VDLITKINLRDYYTNASDLGAINATIQKGGLVYNCSKLHAKVYIIDDRQCIITSANLTTSGLKRNAECGVITDDANLLCSTLSFYNTIVDREDVSQISKREVDAIAELLARIPSVERVVYPKLELSSTIDRSMSAISSGLSGWKKDVFLSLSQFGEIFTSIEVGIIARQLQTMYPKNNNREAKVRQVLQQLRDLGLVEFSSPGVYKKLWI
jgi:hypothetical protein